jgi:type I restriction enzyme S subunit
MNTKWQIKKLGEICNVIAGQSPPGKYYNNAGNGLPFYQGKKEFREKFIGEPTTWTTHITKEAQKNDILMSVRAPVGPINFSTGKICIGRGLAAIRTSKLIDKEFLFYFLLKHENEIIGNSGAVFNSISKTQIDNILISFPPISEQKNIVTILDGAFATIDKAKFNAEQNLNNAKVLFENYLRNVFENKGEDWEEKTLEDVCEISSKLIDPKNSKFQNMIHIGAGNIESKKGTLLDLKTAKEENLISGKFLFDESMVLYSKIRPYLMKVVHCDFQGLCSADIYPLRPFKEKMTKDFLYHLLLTKDFTEYAIFGSQRAGMPKVNREHLFGYRFYLPPLNTQHIVVQKINALSAETKKLEAIYQIKINTLNELTTSILQKAFNGELKTENMNLNTQVDA